MIESIIRGLPCGKTRGLALAASLLATGASIADADFALDREPLRATAAGYSAAGMLAAVAEGLNEIVRREYPGSSFVYEPGNPAGGLVRMVTGDPLFAVQSAAELELALAGSPPFPRKYSTAELLPVARIAEGFVVQVYARQEFLDERRIGGLADIAARHLPVRVSVNPKGNVLGQALATIILGHYGLDYEKIEAWGGEIVYLSTRPSNDLMRDRRLDIVITAGFAPSSSVAELAAATPLRFLDLPRELVDRMVTTLGMEIGVLPAGTYNFVPEDLRLPQSALLITAGPRTPDIAAYKLARALHNQFDYYRSLHPSFAGLTADMLQRTGRLARHPGAERFYREIGANP